MSLTTSSSPDTHDPIGQRAAEAAMAWHGWGSPVSLAIALVGAGVAAVLARFTLFGL